MTQESDTVSEHNVLMKKILTVSKAAELVDFIDKKAAENYTHLSNTSKDICASVSSKFGFDVCSVADLDSVRSAVTSAERVRVSLPF